MNFKTTIVLLVLLAAVGGYVGFNVMNHDKKPETTSTDSTKLVNLESADVTKVALTQSDGSRVVLEKSGTQWKLTEPMNAPAESFGAEDLVRQVTDLKSRGQVAADQVAAVGLDHPSYVVELTGKDGKVHKISLPTKPKIGDTFDVLVDDHTKPDVVVASSLYDQLDKPASSYRSKKLIDVTSDQIKQVAITSRGSTLRLEKEGSDWKIVEPKSIPADSSAVSSLVSAIADLNASDFIQSPSTSASYGLAKPTLTVWFDTAAPSTQPAAGAPAGTTIAFGRFASIEQKDVYAAVNNSQAVMVSTSSEDSLNKTALDLRDKKIVDIDPAHVTGFTLSVNKAATTQPTTQPSQQYEYTIVRRKETPKILGPILPPVPATQPVVATTEPASTQPAVATSEPATLPVAATTQPASKWVFESGETGDASDSPVDLLLTSLHPLNAIKYIEKAPGGGPVASYTLTVHVGPTNGKGPADYTLHFFSPGTTGNVTGTHEDLAFETERAILEKLDAKFK